jgi:hypothetical protein
VMIMSSFDQATRTVAKNVQNAQDMAQESWSQIERSVTGSVANVREFHLKTIDMLRSHAEASFDLAEELIGARSPDQIMGAWKSFADREVDMINKHTSELAAMGQTAAKEGAQPFKDAAKRF